MESAYFAFETDYRSTIQFKYGNSIFNSAKHRIQFCATNNFAPNIYFYKIKMEKFGSIKQKVLLN